MPCLKVHPSNSKTTFINSQARKKKKKKKKNGTLQGISAMAKYFEFNPRDFLVFLIQTFVFFVKKSCQNQNQD